MNSKIKIYSIVKYAVFIYYLPISLKQSTHFSGVNTSVVKSFTQQKNIAKSTFMFSLCIFLYFKYDLLKIKVKGEYCLDTL